MTVWGRLYGLAKKSTYDWLDKSQRGEWSKQDQDFYDFISSAPGLNHFTKLYENEKTREWYMSRYGIDYSQVHQPWNLPGGSEVGSFHSSLNYVSDNIKRLYR